MNRVAVLGDLISDHTIFVEPGKIAQEAPVIAYRITGEEFTHGGAGAVSDMVRALGADCELPLMKVASDFEITRKMRFVCKGSRNPAIVGRYDFDVQFQWNADLYAGLAKRLEQYRPDVIIVSDYGKGFVTAEMMSLIMELPFHATVLVDPYTSDWSKYRGGDIILPSRAAAAAFLADGDPRGFSAVITKLDRDGCRLYGSGPMVEFRSVAQSVVDVTGAGDQFIATLAAHLGTGTLAEVVSIANLAAGLQVRRSGVKPVTAKELRNHISTAVA